MQTRSRDWPSSLESMWSAWTPSDAAESTLLVSSLTDALIDLVTALYRREQSFDPLARAYVGQASDAGRPAWSAAGRAVWALGLWRQGDEDSAFLQMVLAELDLQQGLQDPSPEPPGGPFGVAAAANNLGAAYATMRMFELALPHMQEAARLSDAHYGPALRLQVSVDLANLAELCARWALHAESVGRTQEARHQARAAREYAHACARLENPEDAGLRRYVEALAIGARSVISPGEITQEDQAVVERTLDQPVAGDEPAEIVLRAIQARVCRLLGDTNRCQAAAARAAALSHTGDVSMVAVALREAALLEDPGNYTAHYARTLSAQMESARRRTVSGFQTRLALAGLKERYDQVSAERRELQQQLTDAARSAVELVHAATHDALTGLANRTVFLNRLDTVLISQRSWCSEIAVAFVDVDDLKQTNDTYGHAAGDKALCAVAECLLARTMAGDTVARISGDEFAVLLVSPPSVTELDDWGQRLNTELAGAASVSVGICVVEAGANLAPAQVLEAADAQMYRAKHMGKARGALIRLSD